MKKTVIHTIKVSKIGEKIQLQIKLPRNTKSVQAIHVTTTGAIRMPSAKREVGWLWLRIPEQRDVFFAEVVKVPLEDFDRVTFADLEPISFGRGKAWIDGGKETPFSIVVEKCSTLLEGYYIDQLRSDLGAGYLVKIYLTIET